MKKTQSAEDARRMFLKKFNNEDCPICNVSDIAIKDYNSHREISYNLEVLRDFYVPITDETIRGLIGCKTQRGRDFFVEHEIAEKAWA